MKRRFFVSLLAFALTFSLLSSGIMIYAADAGAMTNGDNSEDTLSETSENEDAEESSVEETESDEGFAESTSEEAMTSDLTAEETPEGGSSEDELYVTEDPAETEETDEAAADETAATDVDDTIILEAVVEDATIRISGDADALSGVASLTAVSLSDERIGEYEAALADEDGGMEILAGYSITLLDAAGNAVEPDGTVSVSVTSEALKACQADGNIQIIHNLNTTAEAMEDDAVDSETISVEALEVVSAVSDGSGEIDFTMDSFSEIVIPGGSGIALTAANVTYVAEVEGGNQYETLAAAIADASDGDTVTLLDAIYLSAKITIGKNITLDLNGQTITEAASVTSASDSKFEYTSGSYCLIYVDSSGSLTIQDSASDGNITANVITYCIESAGAVALEGGTVAAYASSGRAIDVTDGSVDISGGAIYSVSRGIYATGAGIDITISGGSISVESNASNYAFGIRAADGAAVTVSGGSISVTHDSGTYRAYGIYMTGTDSSLTFSDGSVSVASANSTSAYSVYGNGSTLSISGGSISAINSSTGSAFGVYGYGNVMSVFGGSISAKNSGTGKAYGGYVSGTDSSLTISNGSISAETVSANALGVYVSGTYGNVNMEVSGGGISATSNASSSVGIYEYNSNVSLTISSGNISGMFGLNVANPSDSMSYVTIDGGNITATDEAITSGADSKNISIEINGGTIYSPQIAIDMPQNTSSLTINGGTITGGGNAINIRSGNLTITGGEITATGDYTGYENATDDHYWKTYAGTAILVGKNDSGRELKIDIQGGTITGAATTLYEADLYNVTDNGTNSSVSISGGTFTCGTGESVQVTTVDQSGNTIASITGGYFSKHVYSSDYIADGYICIDNLTGTYSGYHAVVPDTITNANTVVTLSETSFVYNAQAQVPSVTVALAGVTLTEGKHYTVSYSDGSAALAAANVINVGDYTVTVTGTGSAALCEVFAADTSRQSLTLSGSATESFEITAATPTVALTGVSSKTYDGEAVSAPTVSVSLVGSDTYSGTPVLTYYSVASDGTLTKLDGAPSAVGDYMVVANVSDAGDNYNSASASATFTISEAGTDSDDTDDQEDDDSTTSSAASEETSAEASSSVQTGDTNPLLPLAGTCAAALAVIAVLVVVRRRKRA